MAQAAGELVAGPVAGVPSVAMPRWRFVLWLGALTVLVGLLAATYLAYTGSVATSSYNIQRLRAERDQWRVRNAQLRVELAKVQSLTWVEHEAVTRLGMQKPDRLTYLAIQPVPEQAANSSTATARAR